MYVNYNPNPQAARVSDCTIRAICKLTGKSWEEVYIGTCIEGLLAADMPSANKVWGKYLKRLGYRREMIPDTCPECYTVADFAADHPLGRYLLALDGHVVTLENGDWFDTWDSGAETPIFYWLKEE